MSTARHILRVETILKANRQAPSGFYTLYAQQTAIGIIKGRITPPSAELIITLTSKDINDGPTCSMWNRIEDKIRTLIKEKKL